MTRNRRQRRDAEPGRDPEVRRTSIRRRMLVTGTLLGLGMAAASVQIAVFQTAEHAELRREASQIYRRDEQLDDWRGDLQDREGGLLATTVHRWAVRVDPRAVEAPRATARRLAELLPPDASTIAERLGARDDDLLLDAADDPVGRAAREAVEPFGDAVATALDYEPGRLDRRLNLLRHFWRLDQLRGPGTRALAEGLDEVARATTDTLAVDDHALRPLQEPSGGAPYVARDLPDRAAKRLDRARRKEHERCRRREEDCTNRLAGIDLEWNPQRYYPRGELASQLLGTVGHDERAFSGLETALDGLLSGGDHEAEMVQDSRGRPIFLEGLPRNARFAGANVELTLDPEIQALAERELYRACESSGARAGYAILMRVETGEILAAASHPAFNPNARQRHHRERRPLAHERAALGQTREALSWAARWPGLSETHPDQADRLVREERRALADRRDAFAERVHARPNPSRHTAFQSAYEPGSIMKVFTLATWLDADLHGLEHTYPLHDGAWELDTSGEEHVIHDSHAFDRDRATPAFALKKSSNIVFAQLGLELGAERLGRALSDFGFGRPTGSVFPDESRGKLRDPAGWGPIDVANVAFGQGVSATGIQLVRALAALGNEGELMRPMLVRRIVAPDGETLRREEPEVVRRVVSAETATETVEMMRAVVQPDGTGHEAAIPEYPVAGKTGTGQKPHLRKRGYAEDRWVGTFFGLAPAGDPELAALVLVDEPQGEPYGGVVAAPAFKRIVRGALRHLDVPPPHGAGRRVAWLDPDASPRGKGREPARANLDAAPPVDPEHAGPVPVPDFEGMTLREARRRASRLGLSVAPSGTGTVRRQSLAPQRRVERGRTVELQLEPRASAATASATPRAAAPSDSPPAQRPPELSKPPRRPDEGDRSDEASPGTGSSPDHPAPAPGTAGAAPSRGATP